MMGDIPSSYVRNCSVHHTYNRAMTIHGVHFFRVLNNVAYNNMGHAFFIEDSIEQYNTIKGNLAMRTRASASLLDTDNTPASFWITNPNNYIVDNAAAGSDRYGFWFDLQPFPTGPSATTEVCPRGMNNLAFSGNTAHSNGRYGLRIFNEWAPRTIPCDGGHYLTNPPIVNTMSNSTFYNNGRNGIIASRIGGVRFERMVAANNGRAQIEVSEVVGIDKYAATKGQQAYLANSIMVGHTSQFPGGIPTQPDFNYKNGFIAPQDDGFYLYNNTFAAFDLPGHEALSSCSHCEFPQPRNNGAKKAYYSNTTYINVDNKVAWGVPYKGIFRDLDGTLTGLTQGSYATAYWPHLDIPGVCTANPPGWENSMLCDVGHADAGPNFSVVKLAVFGHKPKANLDSFPLAVRRGGALAPVLKQPIAGDTSPSLTHMPWRNSKYNEHKEAWAVAVQTGRSWEAWIHDPNGSIKSWDDISLQVWDLQPGERFWVTLNFTTGWDHLEVHRDGKAAEIVGTNFTFPSNSGDWADKETGSNFWNLEANNRSVSILFNGDTGPDSIVTIKGNSCPRNGCPSPEAAPVENFYRAWSNATQWPYGRLPESGEDVTIPAGWKVLLDVSPNRIGTLKVQGELKFDHSQASLTLETRNILVDAFGFLSIGDATAAYNNTAVLKFSGHPGSAYLSVQESVDAGNNGLVVIGRASLYGKTRTTRLAYLGAIAAKGATTVTIDRAIDWLVGDKIVIAPTEFSYREAEVRTITAVSGQVLTLDSALTYKHYGAAATQTISGQTLEVRAEVALLTRNLRIEGTERVTQYGCRVLATSFVDSSTTHTGKLQMRDVEIFKCGQSGTKRHALELVRAAPGNPADPTHVNATYLHGLSVWNSFNDGLHVDSTHSLTIQDTVVYSTIGSNFFITAAANTTLRGNYGIQSIRRSLLHDMEMSEVLGNFVAYTDCVGFQAHGNAAAGSMHFGFLLRADPWSAGASGATQSFSANVAHGNRVGLYLWPHDVVVTTDTRIEDWTLVKSLEAGLYYRQWGDVLNVSNVRFSDNLVGVLIEGQPNGNNMVPKQVRYNNLVMVGAGVNPGCGFDAALGCGGDFYHGCEAPYAPGTSARRGFLHVQTLIKGQQLPRATSHLTWYGGVMGASAPSTLPILYTDIAFHGWQASNLCGRPSYAISTNPESPDLIPNARYSGLTWADTDAGARYHSDQPPGKWANPTDCGDFPCTAPLNVVGKDLDGSLTGAGVAGRVVVSNNPTAVHPNSALCNKIAAWNSYICKDLPYDLLLFESLDGDTQSRRVSPVVIEMLEGVNGKPYAYNNTLNSMMDHGWDQGYTSLLRYSRFPAMVLKGYKYSITFAGTNPRNLRFQLPDDTGSEGVVIQIQYGSPEVLEISVAGTVVGASTNMCDIRSASGCNYWDNPTRLLTFTLKGTAALRIKTVDAVRTSLTLQESVTDFYDKGGTVAFMAKMAFALNIPLARFKVVSIVAGSTILDFAIISQAAGTQAASGSTTALDTSNATATAADQVELTSLSTSLSTALSAGTISTGFTVTASSVVVSLDPVPITSTITTTASSPTKLTTIPFTITLSADVSDLALSDFTVGNGTAVSLTGSGAVYTLTVTVSGVAELRIDLNADSCTDSLGNKNIQQAVFLLFDTTAPAAALSTSASAVGTGVQIEVAISFGEATTPALVAANVTVAGAAHSVDSLTSLDTTGEAYTLYITATSTGTITVNLPAGTVTDTGGNANTASSTLSIVISEAPPSGWSPPPPSPPPPPPGSGPRCRRWRWSRRSRRSLKTRRIVGVALRRLCPERTRPSASSSSP
mmetsp:Transcript_29621/g.95059  ORF Transcript_29621/g.95059 Transcript_29621/m.95059 type:complete len:1807 (+) Transcript_29621:66-5486(+)